MDSLDLSYTSDYKDYMMTTSDDEDYEDWKKYPTDIFLNSGLLEHLLDI